MTKKDKRNFVKDVLKITKLLTYKMINEKENNENLFKEIKYCLKAVEYKITDLRKDH